MDDVRYLRAFPPAAMAAGTALCFSSFSPSRAKSFLPESLMDPARLRCPQVRNTYKTKTDNGVIFVVGSYSIKIWTDQLSSGRYENGRLTAADS